MIRTGFLLIAFGLVPVISNAASCENCYQDGLDAQQRGELEHALSSFMSGCEQDDGAACNAASHMLAKGEGAPVRQCLGDSDTRRVTLATEGGRIVSLSVDPDDSVGRCVASALGRAHIEGLTCSLEASISR